MTPPAFRLTPMQEGMLFHTMADPKGGAALVQLVLHLREHVDAVALRRAWELIGQRHPVLRTAFCWDDSGRWHQRANPQAAPEWSEEDQRDVPAAEQEPRLGQFLRQDRERGFNPHTPPLLRVALHRLAVGEYRLIATVHRALLDGRSQAMLLQEVFSLYQSLCDGSPPTPPPVVPYEQYLAWRQAQTPAGAEAYWRRELAGFTAPTPLPRDRVDRPGLLSRTRPPCDAETHLSPAVTRELEAFAAAEDVNLGTLVQGAWALLLTRSAGEDDVLFGTLCTGRRATVPDADQILGVFVNPVPLRVRCPPESLLGEWLRTLRAQLLALRPHELTPLPLVQGWSEVPAGRGLFDSLVAFDHRDPAQSLRAAGGAWAHRSIRVYEQTTYALTLTASGGTDLHLRLQYDPAQFEEATIHRMLGHLETLLTGFTTGARSRLGELPILTAAERTQLIHTWNTPRRDHPPGPTLVSCFEQQVERTPDRLAVVCGGQRLTYRELNTRANRLAHRLARHGVAAESKVALFVERSVELVVSILGILKAGGGYVPLDPAYPMDRIAFMLGDARVDAVVTQQTSAGRFDHQRLAVVCVDDAGAEEPAGNPAANVRPENLAYVIYTSGSTGQPKGVLVTHYNVVRLFQATAAWYQFNEDDVWTLFHSCAFDFSVWELWGALLHGGRLVVVPYLVSRAPEQFHALLASEGVTVLNQTPSAFQQLIEVDRALSPPRALALRYVIFGGEALEVGSLRPWFERHGDTRPQLINMYGITETTVHVTYRPVTAADLAGGSVIGERIPDLELYLLDPQRSPVPVGVAGELYVGGAGLARGYLHRPELTAERFVASPFDPAARLYRTGDRARYLPNGDIEYLGRLDHQVKIRGFRVELGEIEAAIVQHPAVRAAVVLTHQDPAAGTRLVAYVVPDHGAIEPAALREHLARRLPDYMLPAVFVPLERLPLTGNGKVDRRALPAPELQRPAAAAGFVAPGTPGEKRLAEIWSRILGIARVGAHDNFFELGGNSLLVVQLLAQLRAAGHPGVEIATLFQYPTVQMLAAHLAGKSGPTPMNDVLRRARRQAAALQPHSVPQTSAP